MQARVEEVEDALLEAAFEVDHHVAADDHVELVERPVGSEVVLREDDVPQQRAVERGAVVRATCSSRRTRRVPPAAM